MPSSSSSESISIIIPAFREAPRLPGVLDALAGMSLDAEVIVVDDGSGDGTFEAARRFGSVRAIRLAEHRGKGAALQAGLDAACSDIIVFSDADLVGFTPAHVRALAAPLAADRSLDMTIGRFTHGRWRTDLSQAVAPMLNGQRALTRRFAGSLPDLSGLGFGVETFLSRFARLAGARVGRVSLPGVTQALKEEKYPTPLHAAPARLRMYREAARGWQLARDAWHETIAVRGPGRAPCDTSGASELPLPRGAFRA
jgi:polyisoprenyl-phosphate glycosyltransferase